MSYSSEFKEKVKLITERINIDLNTQKQIERIIDFWEESPPKDIELAMKVLLDYWANNNYSEKVAKSVVDVMSFLCRDVNSRFLNQKINEILSYGIQLKKESYCDCITPCCIDPCSCEDLLLKIILWLLINKKFGLKEIKTEA